MALPRKVKQQLDAAEALLQQANNPQQNEPEQAPETPEPEPAEASSAQPTAPEVKQPPEPAPTEPPSTAKPPQHDEDIAQKYRTLQGIHRYLDERVKQLEKSNSQLEARLEAAAKPVEKPKPEAVVDPRDSDVFGEDLVQMVQRVAQTMFGSTAKSFDERIAAIEQRLEGTANAVNKTAEEVFYDRLRALVPDYEQVNVADGFLAWLSEEDPVYGVPRQQALTAAANALDAGRVAKVFMAYKALSAPPVETKLPKTSATPLDKQLAPSSVAAAPAASTGKPKYTVGQVQSFYKDLQLGKYRGKEAEADQIEALINAALAEGRIVDGPPRAANV